ncbi:MAG: 30S ribosomal protein S20 [bacterium]
MAYIKSAKKRNRQNIIRRSRNRALRTRVRNAVKDVMASIGSGQNSGESLKKAQSLLARAASKGIIHRNTASRKAARLARRLHQAGSSS